MWAGICRSAPLCMQTPLVPAPRRTCTWCQTSWPWLPSHLCSTLLRILMILHHMSLACAAACISCRMARHMGAEGRMWVWPHVPCCQLASPAAACTLAQASARASWCDRQGHRSCVPSCRLATDCCSSKHMGGAAGYTACMHEHPRA